MFRGRIPVPGYDNTTFVCDLEPFEEFRYAAISNDGQLTLAGDFVHEGNCKLRQVKLDFLFLYFWDGVIKMSKDKKACFVVDEPVMDKDVVTGFSDVIETNDPIDLDIDHMFDFDVALGSTNQFLIEFKEDGDVVGLSFQIESVASIHVEMKATLKNDGDNPIEARYEFENDDAKFIFNKRRLAVPYFLPTHGLIMFKKLRDDRLTVIIFATDGNEMRFQGTTKNPEVQREKIEKEKLVEKFEQVDKKFQAKANSLTKIDENIEDVKKEVEKIENVKEEVFPTVSVVVQTGRPKKLKQEVGNGSNYVSANLLWLFPTLVMALMNRVI